MALSDCDAIHDWLDDYIDALLIRDEIIIYPFFYNIIFY